MERSVPIGQPPAELLHLIARLYAGPDNAPGSGQWQERSALISSPDALISLQNRAERAVACAVLDRLPFALLVVDSQCRLRYENQPARDALDRADLLVRDDDRIRPWSENDLAGFVEAAERTCTDMAWPTQGLEIPVARRHWRTSMRLLGLRMGAGAMAKMIVLMPDVARERSLRRLLMTLFALTAAETDIAVLMMAGFSIEEVARRRAVRTATVRLQWQDVQYKVGSGGGAALIELLYAPSCFRQETDGASLVSTPNLQLPRPKKPVLGDNAWECGVAVWELGVRSCDLGVGSWELGSDLSD